MITARVALALQADGWYLRSEAAMAERRAKVTRPLFPQEDSHG